jgi:predicted NAD/FAD-dependent oxidoreductase
MKNFSISALRHRIQIVALRPHAAATQLKRALALFTFQTSNALPAMTPPHISEQTARLTEGLYVAGDYRNVSSINGAFASGRRAAEALLIDGL